MASTKFRLRRISQMRFYQTWLEETSGWCTLEAKCAFTNTAFREHRTGPIALMSSRSPGESLNTLYRHGRGELFRNFPWRTRNVELLRSMNLTSLLPIRIHVEGKMFLQSCGNFRASTLHEFQPEGSLYRPRPNDQLDGISFVTRLQKDRLPCSFQVLRGPFVE